MPNSSSFVKYKLLLPSTLPRLSQPYMLLWVRCPSLTATTCFAHTSLCGTASFSALCLQIEIVGVIKVGRGSRAIAIVFIVVLHSCESFSLKNDDNKSNNAKHVAALLFYEQRSKHEGGERWVHDRRRPRSTCVHSETRDLLGLVFLALFLAWSCVGTQKMLW
jgi:hypothetical protein